MAVILLGVMGVRSVRQHRKRTHYDAAFLQLAILAATPDLTHHPSNSDVRVWIAQVGGRSASVGRSVGIVGPAAHSYARWIGAQILLVRPDLQWRDGADLETETACLWIRGPSAVDDSGPVTLSGRTTGHCYEVAWAPSISELPPRTAQILTPRGQIAGPGWLANLGANDVPGVELPSQIGLPESAEIDVGPSATTRRWSEFLSRQNRWSVPVGVRRRNDLSGMDALRIDLTSMGPHALLAGGTGSGKSVALQTWLRSLALHVPPTHLRLVLIDYKGGAGLGELASLPHVESFGTDLEASTVAWQLRQLRRVLQERKRHLARSGHSDVTRWEEVDPETAPGRLLVVVDEFQALADDHPQLLGALCRLAAQGRSLGFHLLLSTQRPGPALSADLRATLNLRIALHCIEPADSLAIRGDNRAAQLPRIPGRAVLDDIEFQFALSPDLQLPESPQQHLLWPLALPGQLTAPDLTPFADCRTGIAIGLRENPVPSAPLLPLIWEGQPLLIAAPPAARREVMVSTFAIATDAAHRFDVPLHLLGPTAGFEYEWTTHLTIDRAAESAYFLSTVLSRGPTVLVITDLAGVFREMENRGATAEIAAVWERILGSASRCGIKLLIADADASPRAARIPCRLLRVPHNSMWSDHTMIRVLPTLGTAEDDSSLSRLETVSTNPGRFLATGFTSEGTPLEPLMTQIMQYPQGSGCGMKNRNNGKPTISGPLVVVGAQDRIPALLAETAARRLEADQWLAAVQTTQSALLIVEPGLDALRYIATRHPGDALWLKSSFPFDPGAGVALFHGRVWPFDAADPLGPLS